MFRRVFRCVRIRPRWAHVHSGKDLPNDPSRGADLRLWKTRFNGDTGLIGKTVLLNPSHTWSWACCLKIISPIRCAIFIWRISSIRTDQSGTHAIGRRTFETRRDPGIGHSELKVIAEQFRARYPDFVDKSEP